MPEMLNGRALRIALVLARNGNGGSEGQARLLAIGLHARGHDVRVVVVDGGAGVEGFGDVPVVTLLKTRKGGVAALLDAWHAWWRLRRILAEGQFDVVHAIMARAYVLAPLVCTTLPQRPRVVAWRRNEGIHVSNRGALILERWSARCTDVIVCNARSVLEYWMSRGVSGRCDAEVVPNALERWRFDRPTTVLPTAARRRVLAIGGLKPVKNYEILIDAVAALDRDVQPEVVILGEGELSANLACRAAELGVALILPGHVTDARPWMASADVYVQTSTSEGLSNALLEAMAQGMPIVASDVGGTRDALGDAGVIFQSGDVDALAASLRGLLVNLEIRERLGASARMDAMDRYVLDVVLDRHLMIYQGAT